MYDALKHQQSSQELGSLCFSVLQTKESARLCEAANIYNLLEKLGLNYPFFVVHDLSLLLNRQAIDQLQLKARTQTLKKVQEMKLLNPHKNWQQQHQAYLEFLQEFSNSSLCSQSIHRHMEPALKAALIGKILSICSELFSKKTARILLPEKLSAYQHFDPIGYISAPSVSSSIHVLEIFKQEKARLSIHFQQIDLDTLRFLNMFNDGSELDPALAALEYYQTLNSPEIQQIIQFSFDLLPSILETKQNSAAQHFSIDGYASISTHGHLDRLLPSELAYDPWMFEQRFLNNELFYYTHEKENLERENLHYILIDCSATMRGLRNLFARGLAITLAKKRLLEGEKVMLRFFDAQLYERQVPKNRQFKVPYLLAFKGEKGRNPNQAFREFDKELTRLTRDTPKNFYVTFITHGRCSLEKQLVEQLGKKAHLTGIFLMPSNKNQHYEFLEDLDQSYIIHKEDLLSPKKRQQKALQIIQ